MHKQRANEDQNYIKHSRQTTGKAAKYTFLNSYEKT